MKKVLLSVSVFALLAVSCSTDLDIAANWKEIPVVYALLNPTDTVHYIKVTKAFLDPKRSAFEVAQLTDSIFYKDSLVVSVKRKDQWGNVAQEYFPTLVDGNLIGLAKDSGTFANQPNWLYQLPLTIDNSKNGPDESYELIVQNVSSGLTASATTKAVKQFNLSYPPEDSNYLLPAAYINTINETEYKDMRVAWKNAQNGRYYEMKIEFTYIEFENIPGAPKDTIVIEWKPVGNVSSTSISAGETLEVSLSGESFYNFLSKTIGEKPNYTRSLPKFPVKFNFFVAGQELYDLLRVTQAQSGITGLQASPDYTNIENGLGLFSSRYNYTTIGFGFNANSIEVLVCGDITSNLNFVGATCR